MSGPRLAEGDDPDFAMVDITEEWLESLDPIRDALAIEDAIDEALQLDAEDDAPIVCPGCHAVGAEPCKPGCIDAEMERKREEEAELRYWYGDDQEDDSQ